MTFRPSVADARVPDPLDPLFPSLLRRLAEHVGADPLRLASSSRPIPPSAYLEVALTLATEGRRVLAAEALEAAASAIEATDPLDAAAWRGNADELRALGDVAPRLLPDTVDPSLFAAALRELDALLLADARRNVRRLEAEVARRGLLPPAPRADAVVDGWLVVYARGKGDDVDEAVRVVNLAARFAFGPFAPYLEVGLDELDPGDPSQARRRVLDVVSRGASHFHVDLDSFVEREGASLLLGLLEALVAYVEEADVRDAFGSALPIVLARTALRVIAAVEGRDDPDAEVVDVLTPQDREELGDLARRVSSSDARTLERHGYVPAFGWCS